MYVVGGVHRFICSLGVSSATILNVALMTKHVDRSHSTAFEKHCKTVVYIPLHNRVYW